jgi:hypothetical protein
MTADTLQAALDRAGGGVAAVAHRSTWQARWPIWTLIGALARAAGAAIVEDACHAVGGRDAAGRAGRQCGATGDLMTFSLHPVKTIAAGERAES